MRNILLSWLLLCAGHADGAQQYEEPSILEELAVVGRLVEIEPVPSSCPTEPQATPEGDVIVCFQFDEVFRARYEILHVVAGTPASREVTFTIADHYGFPDFARYESALLFLGRDTNGWFLHKYKGFQMQRTDDGGWAHCGKPYGGADLIPERIAFAQDIGGPRGQLMQDDDLMIDEWWRDPHLSPYISIEGQRVRCREGVRLMALYEAVVTSLETP